MSDGSRSVPPACFHVACGDASAVSHKSPTGVAVVLIFFLSFDSSIARSHLRSNAEAAYFVLGRTGVPKEGQKLGETIAPMRSGRAVWV